MTISRFHGNSRYGKILTKKEPIKMLGFTLPYNKDILKTKVYLQDYNLAVAS